MSKFIVFHDLTDKSVRVNVDHITCYEATETHETITNVYVIGKRKPFKFKGRPEDLDQKIGKPIY